MTLSDLTARRFGLFHLAGGVLAGAILGAVIVGTWPSRETYESCMLREMRGQPATSAFLAYRACQGLAATR